jgi:signal transduction histidine kinase
VRAVARRYGGDAFAESEGEGRGSTFTLKLPRVYRA